ncbi:Poly(A) polymerase [Entamoeba marina]
MNIQPTLYELPIVLSQHEIQLFSTINNVNTSYNLNSVVRVVGGWVRDKILQKESNDIDITVDNMSGVDFCKHISKYLSTQNIPSKIQECPGQSEHIGNATIFINGFVIDVGRLRAEEYDGNSRIPITRVGTPLEDCLRRDFTINALFYRISDGFIEDYCGGYQDIQNEQIRTPIPAIQSFVEDPLRVLRCIRFACRFGFSIDAETYYAIHDNSVVEAMYKVKKSRRIHELCGVLESAHPAYGFHVLHSAQLLKEVMDPGDITSIDWNSTCEQGIHLMYICSKIHTELLNYPSTSDSKCLFLSSLCLTLRNFTYLVKSKQLSIISHIIVDGMKFTSKDKDMVNKVLDGYDELLKWGDSPIERLHYGRVLLRAKEMWRYAFILYFATRINDVQTPVQPTMKYRLMFNDQTALLDQHLQTVVRLGLDNVWTMKAMLDGNQIAELYQAKKGRWVSSAVCGLIEYQIQFPDASLENCKAFLLGKRFDKQ